jgi:hypothetical protein
MAWRGNPLFRVAALVPMVAYLGSMLPSTRTAVNYWVERIYPIRGLVLGVQSAQRAHPGKIIVLDGVSSALYDDAVGASAFLPWGIDHVYLTPESRDSIHPLDNPEKLNDLVLEPGVMRSAITHDQVVVYSPVRDHLRNLTWDYERSALDHQVNSEPRRVDVGNPLFGYLLGPEWYPLESDFRWMPKHATLRIGGPDSDKDRLLLQGFCPDVQLRRGPLHLFVTVDRIPLEEIEITEPENSFRRLLVMPTLLIGRKAVEVEITVDRTTHSPDGRELGVVFGTISIQP